MGKRTNILFLVLGGLLLWWGFMSAEESTQTTTEVIVEEPREISQINPDDYARNKQAIKNILAMKKRSIQDIKDYGYGAIPILTELYKEAEDNQKKAIIADVFWRLGWKSAEIEEALIGDLDTDDVNLKVQVQWGIAKSTNNSKVLQKLLYNLENDPSAYVRDKAACALASDFIHISPAQRMMLLRGLVQGLSNDIQQVRHSSILALKIQTGQTKGFVAAADVANRAASIESWNDWLDEYERNL